MLTELENLVDLDRLQDAERLLPHPVTALDTHSDIFDFAVSLQITLCKFEVARQLVLHAARTGEEIKAAAHWSRLLYDMENNRLCANFIRALPPPCSQSKEIVEIARDLGDAGISVESHTRKSKSPLGEIKAGMYGDAHTAAEPPTADFQGDSGYAVDFMRSQAAMELQDRDLFWHHIERAKAYGIRRHQTLLLEARVQCHFHDFAGAEKSIGELLAIVPRCNAAFKLKAYMAFERGRLDEFGEHMQTAFEINSADETACGSLVGTNMRAGNLGAAWKVKSDYSRAVRALRGTSKVLLAAFASNGYRV